MTPQARAALCALVGLVLIGAASADAWNVISIPNNAFVPGDLTVSQVGPTPQGAGPSSGTNPDDVRATSGETLTATKPLFTAATISKPLDGAAGSYSAPYAGCYYFYNSSNLLRHSACTTYATWTAFPTLDQTANEPPAVTLNTTSGGGSTFERNSTNTNYRVVLAFDVPSGYAGVAFEFLDLAKQEGRATIPGAGAASGIEPFQDDTNCGIWYDNLIALKNADTGNEALGKFIPSPHDPVNVRIYNPADGTNATNGVWEYTREFDAASSKATYTIENFNDALKHCGWRRNEANASVTLFQAQIRISTMQQGRNIRGALLKSHKETIIQIGFGFRTNVSVSTVSFEVQSNITTYAALVKQVFDATSSVGHLLLYTSSQGPYQLKLNNYSRVLPTPADNPEWVKATSDSNMENYYLGPLSASAATALLLDSSYKTGTSSGTAECYDAPTGGAPANYTLRNTTGETKYTVCSQNWYMRLSNPSACADVFADHKPLNINGNWSVTFDVICHETYNGACSQTLGGGNVYPDTVVLTFSTASDDYCPRILDTVSATIDLKVYQDYARQQPQTQFVFGTTSYFTATLRSTIAVSHFYAEEVSITNGFKTDNSGVITSNPSNTAFVRPALAQAGTLPRQILFANGFNNDGTNIAEEYFNNAGQERVGNCDVASKQNKLVWGGTVTPTPGSRTDYTASNCQFSSVTDTNPAHNWYIEQYKFSQTTGQAVLEPSVYFQWRWNDVTSSASGDFAQATTVRFDGRVRYQDQASLNKMIGEPQLMVAFEPHLAAGTHLQATTGAVSQSTSVGVSQASSSSTAPTISTTTIVIAGAALAAVVVMAAAAVIVLRSRNHKVEEETNLESVTLGSIGHTASSAQISA